MPILSGHLPPFFDQNGILLPEVIILEILSIYFKCISAMRFETDPIRIPMISSLG